MNARGYEYSLYLSFSYDQGLGAKRIGLTRKNFHKIFGFELQILFPICQIQILFLLRKLVLSYMDDDTLNKWTCFVKCTVHICCMKYVPVCCLYDNRNMHDEQIFL